MNSILFQSIIQNGAMTGTAFLLATVCSLGIGLFIAFMYSLRSKSSRSFLVTLVLLPAIVQMVIMLVNGNIGAGVAVAGTFSLVRFRSAAGKGQEITSIFLAMAVGLATGMGYLGIAILFAVIITVVNLLLSVTRFGEGAADERVLRITIPEDLDFEGIFDDLFRQYLDSCELTDVRTTNMGSLYRLEYTVRVKNTVSVKEMMDAIRGRNGNLEVVLGRPVSPVQEL